jgi:FkbH-like protein
MIIAYLTPIYPMPSATFIRREIAALEAQGIVVHRFAMRRFAGELVEPADQAERERTCALVEGGAWGLASAFFLAALLWPRRWAIALATTVRMGWRSERGLLRHLIYLAEACLARRRLAVCGARHVHAHFASNAADIALLCHLLGGPPYSVTVHGPEDFDAPRATGLGEKIHRASFVVAVSQFTRSQLCRWCDPEDWPKIHVIHCGVDSSFLPPVVMSVPDRPRLVNVGRMSEQKGQLLLVEAAAQLRDQGIECELVIVGDGPMRGEIEKLVRALGLGERVRITGYLSNLGVRQELEEARALVLPSFAEGLPVVIMEALAVGRPVIGTYVAGIPELVEAGINGWLVPAGAVEPLAEAMAEALTTDVAALNRMGRAGAARVAAQHNVTIEAGKLAELFRTSMKQDDDQPVLESGRIVHRLAVAATFTAEPLSEALALCLEEAGQPAAIDFAPYDQIFQQLLDPKSLLGQNHQGINIVLVRLDDWRRFDSSTDGREEVSAHVERTADELIRAVRAVLARSTVPLVLAFCPSTLVAVGEEAVRGLLARAGARVARELEGAPGLCLVQPDDFRHYPVGAWYDAERDRLGHIPYTPLFYAALGIVLARKIHALTRQPFKVIVLDCDNTLWKGVVGEEGVDGIVIPPALAGLQQSMVELSSKGFLLCLCSKNDEADVLEVLDRRRDMVLKRDHLVAWRINWRPKPENLRSLAEELNLGLDSFIFLDDNPVECALLRAECPEVLTLRLPMESDVAAFLTHVWAFDRLKITSEDKLRTAMYQEEAKRARFQQEAPTIDEFLAGLDLRVAISVPTQEQLARVAQLTQRTNQFNFTTVRRSESEVGSLSESGLSCRIVEVSDRFGDYGIVGAMIFAARADALEIDSFLLSCRVLGRGVEHRMLNELGEIARGQRLSLVNATLIPTKKNQPARQFLESVAARFREETPGGSRYAIPSEVAAVIAYKPGLDGCDSGTALLPAQSAPDGKQSGSTSRSLRYQRMARVLSAPERVLESLQARSGGRRSRPFSDVPVAARTETETALAELWADLLRIEPIGIRDGFFDLGGTSLLAVDLFARIERQLGKRLPLTSLIEAPTVEKLALVVEGAGVRDSLVLIRAGGDKSALFLVHDGDGETMLYRNLALLLEPEHAVFGLQPLAQGNAPLVHTRIAEMAAHHIERIRSVQPQGPYLLGGMCAGGVIAFEMARQLQRQGETVAMVALLDSADIAARPKSFYFASQRMQSFRSVFKHDRSVRFDRIVLAALGKSLRKVRNLITYVVAQRIKDVGAAIRIRLFRFHRDRGLQLPRSLENIPVRAVYQFAERDFRPDGPFDGELVLFRATSGTGSDEPTALRYDDPALGWGRRATRGVRVYDVPGGHSSMLQEPHVGTLAREVQAAIDLALAHLGSPNGAAVLPGVHQGPRR